MPWWLCAPPVNCGPLRRIVSPIEQGYKEPPERALCSKCGQGSHVTCCIDDVWLSICYLPTVVIYSTNEMYFVCENCQERINLIEPKICHHCKTQIPSAYNYCSVCGIKVVENDREENE